MEPLGADRLTRLIDVGRGLISELDLESLLQRVLAVASELTGARYAALGILDERREELERFLTLGVGEAERRAIGDPPRGRGVLGELIAHPHPLRLADVELHPQSYGFPIGHPKMRTFLGVPILIRGAAWGNLYLTENEGGEEFTAGDEAALVVLADWAAIAIENARLYHSVSARRDELERAVRSLEATTEVTRAVGGELDLDRILELIVKRGRALVQARAMLIALRDSDQLHVVAAAGRVSPEVRDMRAPVEGTLGGEALRTRRAHRVDPGSTGLRAPWAEALGARAELVVPLLYRDRALGVIAAFDGLGANPAFSAEDEQLMLAFAASAATAVATGQHVVAEGTRRSMEASERERGRWARELHDETLQEMGALKLLLAAARRSDDLGAVQAALDQGAEQLAGAIDGLRSLITDLRPAALDQLGAGPALEALVDRVARQSGIAVALELDLAYESGRASVRHEPEIEATLYRVVQEALTNAVKHAGATRVAVRVREGERERIPAARSADEMCGPLHTSFCEERRHDQLLPVQRHRRQHHPHRVRHRRDRGRRQRAPRGAQRPRSRADRGDARLHHPRQARRHRQRGQGIRQGDAQAHARGDRWPDLRADGPLRRPNGKPTNDEKIAAKDPKSGAAVANPARNIWVTETALTTALNTAYFAESTATFVIAIGGALLLVGVGFLVLIVVAGRRDDTLLTEAESDKTKTDRFKTAA